MIAPAPSRFPAHLSWDPLQLGLALLVFVQVWRVHSLVPALAVPGLPILATVVALLLLALDRDPRRRVTGLSSPVVRAVLGILVLATLSIPGSLHPRASLEFFAKDYARCVILMVVVAASVRGLADLRRLAWVQVAGAVVFSAVVLARTELGGEGRLRAEAYFYDANDLAMLIVCTLPLIVFLWRPPARGLGRVALAAATGLLMLTFVQAGSRGGFLGFVILSSYLLLRFRGISPVKRVTAVAVLMALLVGLGSDRYFDRLRTLLRPSADYNWGGRSETGRIELWKRGIGYMLDRPVLGIGVAAFERAEGRLSGTARERAQYGRHFKWSAAHNSFVQIGAELGVLGLLLFVMLLASAFGTLSRVRRSTAGEPRMLAQVLTGSLLAYVVTATFLSQAYAAYLYVLLGMVLGLARIAARQPAAVVGLPVYAPAGAPVGAHGFHAAGR